MNKNKLLLTLTLALTLSWLVAPVHAGLRVESPTDSLDNGLVGYWTFDGADISGTNAYDRSPVGTNTGTGDLTLGGNLANVGTMTFGGSGAGCGGADAIAITAASSREWSGNSSFSLTDVALTNQNATVPITVYSGTNTSGNTGSWNWTYCPDAAFFGPDF